MMQYGRNVYVVDAVRTAVGKAGGVFKTVRPDDLLAHCLAGLIKRNQQLDPALIDDVIIGCAMPEAEQGMNVARIASLLAGLPEQVPAMTINRFCSSGLQTVALAANQIALGLADVVIAGGVESMSMVPLGGNKLSQNPAIFTSDAQHLAIGYSMGITAEKVASKWSISREQQDTFALRSHQQTLQAQAENAFTAAILPYQVQRHLADERSGEVVISEYTVCDDEGPRADTSLAALAALKPVFAANGTVTAGNSSQMSDGAAAIMLVSEELLQREALQPMAKFCGFSVAGVAPEVMGIGPIAAVPKLLRQLQLTINDIDWIELNEAFAAQALAVMQELQFNPDKVNPYGGAIASGHPLGATGAVRSTILLHAMKAKQLKYGMVTMCIGTGMGAAGIYQAV
jgi:acetyl-CoA acyltransferase